MRAIRLLEKGRFGNVLLQIFHATLLARQLGCSEIEVFAFEGGPSGERVEVGGLTFLFPRAARPAASDRPTLVGHFFNSYPFESALRAAPSKEAATLVQQALRHLFGPIWRGAPAAGDRTAVVHFRAGDVFVDPNVSPWYAQPPASYYVTAVSHLVATAGVEDALLVFENRGNPAIELTEAWLRQSNIPFRTQSLDLASDARALATATHLVASVSTLCEAAAILSQNLRNYVAFRQVDSHELIHHRLRPLLSHWLDAKGVSVFIVRDVAGAYTPIGDWRASEPQVRLLIDYPAAALAVTELTSESERLDDPVTLRARLAAAESEAQRLRGLLVLARRQAEKGFLRRFVAWARSFARGFGLVAGRRVLDVRQKHEG